MVDTFRCSHSPFNRYWASHPVLLTRPTVLKRNPGSLRQEGASPPGLGGICASAAITRGNEDALNKPAQEVPGSSDTPVEAPIPHDLPDQQAVPDEDPWDVVGTPERPATDRRDDSGTPNSDDEAEEAGTRRTPGPPSGDDVSEQRSPGEPTA
ncbi:hypothetical protein [Streptomyces sp. SID3212]|uniref:hypothetical protein n=1 Tax=Streptomyces sp. SID3212 TaxID=2690259 RepID=UPI001372151B|nr:hypothetical protein [Streptomyces sp. SID3212]MYV55032.1 hypothetical protein [Streptomyces sp. SID3212]